MNMYLYVLSPSLYRSVYVHIRMYLYIYIYIRVCACVHTHIYICKNYYIYIRLYTRFLQLASMRCINLGQFLMCGLTVWICWCLSVHSMYLASEFVFGELTALVVDTCALKYAQDSIVAIASVGQ